MLLNSGKRSSLESKTRLAIDSILVQHIVSLIFICSRLYNYPGNGSRYVVGLQSIH